MLAALQRRLHRIGAGVFLALDAHIFRIGGLVGLVIDFPLRHRHALRAGHDVGKELLFGDIFRRPVGGASDIVPFCAVKQCHGNSSQESKTMFSGAFFRPGPTYPAKAAPDRAKITILHRIIDGMSGYRHKFEGR